MTQSVIGSSAALRYLKNYKTHVDYWHEVNPAFQVAYVDKPEHVPYILEYAAALPKTMIVARIWHPLDGGFHLAPTGKNPDGTPDTRRMVSTPFEYLQAYGDLGKVENIILNVMNEPNANGSPDEMMRLVNWFIDYIPMAASIGCKSVLYNWADRNPKIINGLMDGQFNNSLRLMAAHPELFFMGMHFYGPDEIVSHLDSYAARCQDLKIIPPVVIGTEFGIDSIGDGSPQRGYKTWANYKDIYGGWLVTQVKPPEDATKSSLWKHIKNGTLGGLCVFGEAHPGFPDFDFEETEENGAKNIIKKAALAGEIPSYYEVVKPSPPPIPSPPPPPALPPFTPGERYQITTPQDYVNIRMEASLNGAKVGDVPNKSIVTLFEEKLIGGDYWRKLAFGNLTGWVSMQKGAVQFAPYLPSPSMVNVSIDLLQNIANGLKNQAEQTKALANQLLTAGNQMLAASNSMSADYVVIKGILDKISTGV